MEERLGERRKGRRERMRKGALLPARTSEQGNVIGSVRIYIYIYIYVCTKKNCN